MSLPRPARVHLDGDRVVGRPSSTVDPAERRPELEREPRAAGPALT